MMPTFMTDPAKESEDLVAALRRMAQRMEDEAAESRAEGEHDDALRAEGASGAFLWAANMAEKAQREAFNKGALAGLSLDKGYREPG